MVDKHAAWLSFQGIGNDLCWSAEKSQILRTNAGTQVNKGGAEWELVKPHRGNILVAFSVEKIELLDAYGSSFPSKDAAYLLTTLGPFRWHPARFTMPKNGG